MQAHELAAAVPLTDPRPCGRCGGAVALPASVCLGCNARLLRPQPGPQEDFLGCEADLALYGGAAGGGKSWSLLVDALGHAVDTPGWVGVIFRARASDLGLEDGIWHEARKVYAGTDRGRDPLYRESPGRMDVRWRGGGTLLFRHLDKLNVEHYRGKAYAWIGFDEATEIAIEHIIFLLSRNRTTCGARATARATCNPDPDHDLARWVAPYLVTDRSSASYGCADRSKSGAVRYWARSTSTGRIVFGDTRAAVAVESGRRPAVVRSFAFIPSLLEDNRILEIADPGYRANIETQDAVTEAQLAEGNWLVRRDTGGMLARARWGGIVTAELAPIVARYRAWDFAATKPRATGGKRAKDPDYTGGLRVEFDVEGRFYVSGLEACREDTPERDEMVRRVVGLDGSHWTQVIPVDPAAGGKSAAHYQCANIASVDGAGPCVTRTPSKNKIARATPVADALERGLVLEGRKQPAGYILDRDGWLGRAYSDSGDHPPTLGALLWSQLERFGTGSEVHDDIADMLADAFAQHHEPPPRRVKPKRRAHVRI